MASADPVSEKIDNTMNLFRQNINKKKSEVNRIREEMKLLIDKKSEGVRWDLEGGERKGEEERRIYSEHQRFTRTSESNGGSVT